MRFIIRDRQQGKTTDLLAWMREAPEGEHRICVSHARDRAMQLLRENPDLESWQFVTAEDLRGHGAFSGVLRGRGGRVVLGVDDLDLVLSRLLGWQVGLVTATVEAEVDA